MLKRMAALMLCALSALTVTACAGKNPSSQDNSNNSGKIKVCVTFNAMKEFTEAVGKDKVEITTLIPDGTEPHDFEIKAKDMIKISGARVLVYNGMDMEQWVDDAVEVAGNKNLIKVEASQGVTPIKNADSNERAQYDPHVWLSIKGAETEVENIKNALVKADPQNSSFYEENCSSFVAQLENIYNQYGAKFKSIGKKDFVTGHAAFAYFCRDFGLTQNSVEDVFAEGEPSAQRLNELIEFCKQKNVKTVFVEEMVSPAVSQTLARSIGADVKTIYTLESNEDNKSYLQRMEENISAIYDSLSN